jgi:hypothetical protein
MNCGSVQERLTLYLLGDLGAAEHQQVESHLAACDVCRAHVQDLKNTLDLLSGALADAKAGETLALSREARLRVMNTRPSRIPSLSWVFESHPRLAVAASIMAVVGITWGIVANLRAVRLEPAAPPRTEVLGLSAAVGDRAAERGQASLEGVAKQQAADADETKFKSNFRAGAGGRAKEIQDNEQEGNGVVADALSSQAATPEEKPAATLGIPDNRLVAPVVGKEKEEALPQEYLAKGEEFSKDAAVPADVAGPSGREAGAAAMPAAVVPAPVAAPAEPAKLLQANEPVAEDVREESVVAQQPVMKKVTATKGVGVDAKSSPAGVAVAAAAPAAPGGAVSGETRAFQRARVAKRADDASARTELSFAEPEAAVDEVADLRPASDSRAPADKPQPATGYEAVRRSLRGQVWPPRDAVGEGALQREVSSGEGKDPAVNAAVARFEELLKRGPFGAKVEELDAVADELDALARARGDDSQLKEMAQMARAAAALIRGK